MSISETHISIKLDHLDPSFFELTQANGEVVYSFPNLEFAEVQGYDSCHPETKAAFDRWLNSKPNLKTNFLTLDI